jgi:cadmium resistance protein CadD (predicted permease)
LIFSSCSPEGEDEEENATISGIKSTLKVSMITVMNGGDNIGTYHYFHKRGEQR